MRRTEAEALANLLRTIRSEWDHQSTVIQLQKLDGSLGLIVNHAIAVASDPGNRGPVMLTKVPIARHGNGETETLAKGDPRPCRICERPEFGCKRAQVLTGLDIHRYEPVGLPHRNAPRAVIDSRTDTETVAGIW